MIIWFSFIIIASELNQRYISILQLQLDWIKGIFALYTCIDEQWLQNVHFWDRNKNVILQILQNVQEYTLMLQAKFISAIFNMNFFQICKLAISYFFISRKMGKYSKLISI